MAPEGCSATRRLARRARVVGALLASTASLAAAGPAKASQRKLTGYALDDSTIRTAVAAWFDDRSGAEATYGHISTWQTGGVTDMSWLFCANPYWPLNCDNTAAASFNEDIGAWDTSGVTSMHFMFYYASAFNQDISGWAVHNVKSMGYMFGYASAFNQDIGWCVDEDVEFDVDVDEGKRYGGAAGVYFSGTIQQAFSGTQCESTSCGVLQEEWCGVFSNRNIRTAVTAWISDATAAEATYGHISTWETGGVTDMSYLFCASSYDYSASGYCNSAAASFNEDIGAWDTSGVTSMYRMFFEASAFNQDLGWCVDDGVFDPYGYGYTILDAFAGTRCELTSCGVVLPRWVQMDNCTGYVPVIDAARRLAGASAALLALALL